MKKLNATLLTVTIVCSGFISTLYADTCPQPTDITIQNLEKGYFYSAPGWKNYMPYKTEAKITKFFSAKYEPDSTKPEIGRISSCAYTLENIKKPLILSQEDDEKKVFTPTGENWKLLPENTGALWCRKDIEACQFEFATSKQLEKKEILSTKKTIPPDIKKINSCPAEESIMEEFLMKDGQEANSSIQTWEKTTVPSTTESNMAKQGFISATYRAKDLEDPFTSGRLERCLYQEKKEMHLYRLKENIERAKYEVFPVYPKYWDNITFFDSETDQYICNKSVNDCELKFISPPSLNHFKYHK